MRMKNCSNGHYYDAAKHESCPYCSGGAVDNITKKTKVAGAAPIESKKTEVANDRGNIGGRTEIYTTEKINNRKTTPSTGEETVYIMAGNNKHTEKNLESDGKALLSGWVVIVSAAGRGEYYPLTFGMNTIGRDAKNHIQINNGDNSISRDKHAVIIYDYQNNLFFIKHGEGQFLSYLNGEVLLDTKALNANDKIKVGDTELIFIPLCSNNFVWNV